MEIIQIVAFAFVALFIYLTISERKPQIAMFVVLAAALMIFLAIMGQLQQIIDFIINIAEQAKIDTVYIGIVMKILAIAYLASFCSEICKDAGAGTIASKVELAGKIMILALSVPILLAVLDSILKIL